MIQALRPGGFDGDRTAAFNAWKAENAKASRNMSDLKWHEVVGIIDANMASLHEYFADRIRRTIDAGPKHVPPDETFNAMFPD